MFVAVLINACDGDDEHFGSKRWASRQEDTNSIEQKRKKKKKNMAFHLLDILCSLGRGFHEYQSMVLGELFPFLSADSSSVSQVWLVAYKHDRHVCISMLPRIFQPTRKMVECLPPVEIFSNQARNNVTLEHNSQWWYILKALAT